MVVFAAFALLIQDVVIQSLSPRNDELLGVGLTDVGLYRNACMNLRSSKEIQKAWLRSNAAARVYFDPCEVRNRSTT
jgi:hypothetical protein